MSACESVESQPLSLPPPGKTPSLYKHDPSSMQGCVRAPDRIPLFPRISADLDVQCTQALWAKSGYFHAAPPDPTCCDPAASTCFGCLLSLPLSS